LSNSNFPGGGEALVPAHSSLAGFKLRFDHELINECI
jgi:hypothetical protein